jgi:hypothetical protein
MLANPLMETALVKHTEAARDEVRQLIGEFIALAETTSVPTPTIHRLVPYAEPSVASFPDGSAEIPLRWAGMALLVTAVLAVAGALVLLTRWLLGG